MRTLLTIAMLALMLAARVWADAPAANGSIRLGDKTYRPAEAVAWWDADSSVLNILFFDTARSPAQIDAIRRSDAILSVECRATLHIEFETGQPPTPAHIKSCVFSCDDQSAMEPDATNALATLKVGKRIDLHYQGSLSNTMTWDLGVSTNALAPIGPPDPPAGIGTAGTLIMRPTGERAKTYHPQGAIAYWDAMQHILYVLLLDSPPPAHPTPAWLAKRQLEVNQRPTMLVKFQQARPPTRSTLNGLGFMGSTLETAKDGSPEQLVSKLDGAVKPGGTVRLETKGHDEERHGIWNLRIATRVYEFKR